MTDISLKDYRIHCLQKEYNRYSKFLTNYQEHIEKAKTQKQKELYVNLAAAFNLMSMWLEKTPEVNPN